MFLFCFKTHAVNRMATVTGAVGSVILTKEVAPDKQMMAYSSPVSGSVHPQMSLACGLGRVTTQGLRLNDLLVFVKYLYTKNWKGVKFTVDFVQK